MEPANLIGATATTLGLIQFAPQARATWRNRNDPAMLSTLSVSMLLILITSSTMWSVYGVMTHAYWTGVASIVNVPLGVFMLTLLWRARRLESDPFAVQVAHA